LRRSAVLAAGATARRSVPPQGDGVVALSFSDAHLWPLGTECPLCAARPVESAEFYLRISKNGGSYSSSSLTARGRCCGECRAKLEALGQLRLVALPFVLVGLLAWPFTMGLDVFGWGVGATIATSSIVCAMIAGLPLAMIVRRQRRLRRHLEETSLFLRMRNLVETPRGLIVQEHWTLFSKPPGKQEKVLDLAELSDR
jgi:hypothetical protein